MEGDLKAAGQVEGMLSCGYGIRTENAELPSVVQQAWCVPGLGGLARPSDTPAHALLTCIEKPNIAVRPRCTRLAPQNTQGRQQLPAARVRRTCDAWRAEL